MRYAASTALAHVRELLAAERAVTRWPDSEWRLQLRLALKWVTQAFAEDPVPAGGAGPPP